MSPISPLSKFGNINGDRLSVRKLKNGFALSLKIEAGDWSVASKGRLEKDGSGNLNKIYLLKEYHGQGLGRLLLKTVANQFRSLGNTMMYVVAEASNPTCAFYAKMGGVRKQNTDAGVAVFVWRDL
jgi:GNAT superfamily N-acetyltransferase